MESMSDQPGRFDPGNRLWAGSDESRLRCVRIVESAIHKGRYLLYLTGQGSTGDDGEEELDPRELKGKSLFVLTEDLVEPEEDEYYYHELIGCLVATVAGEEIGTVDTIVRNGPQDILVLDDTGRGEILIPMVSEIVKEVDVERGKILIDPPPGLLDANV